MTYTRGTLDEMGKGSGCTPGSMVLTSRLAKQFYRRSDEEQLGMHLRHLVALAYVRDHEGCPVAHQVRERILHEQLRLRIERRRGFVQDQDRRVLQQRPRDREALSLAP